jgi:hypothetical protein
MNGTIPLLHTPICLLGVGRDSFTLTFLKTLIKEKLGDMEMGRC